MKTTMKKVLSRGPKACGNCEKEFVGDSSKKFCKSCNGLLMSAGVLHPKGGISRVKLVRRQELRS